jgi:RNA polymerase sigma factor (sigma-70 family)
MKTDAELLREFVESHAENAVAELVNRHISMVYSAACRETQGDFSAAEDVTQLVFIELVRKAAALQKHPTLAGWLYTTVRYISGNLRRTDHRRNIREEKACIMNELLQPAPNDSTWREIRPVIDDAMHELEERDRNALLLRFFEGKNLREVGEGLRLNENAARMRVDRALEKLRNLLAKRGVHSTSSALGTALVVGVVAAPPALTAAVTGSVLATATVSAGAGAALFGIMTAAKLKVVGLSALAVAAVSIPVWQQQRYDHLAQENETLRSQIEQMTQSRADASARDQNPERLPSQPVMAAVPKPAPQVQEKNPDGKPKETWRMRFTEYYKLRGGEVLRRVSAPYIPERSEFLRREFRNPRKLPDYLLLKQAHDGFQTRGVGLDQGKANLDGVLRYVLGLKRYEFYGADELLASGVPGDWVVRPGADTQSLLAALEPIFRDATGRNIRFAKSPIDNDVIVVRGSFAPAKEKQKFHVFAENMNKSWAKSSEGDFQSFLEALGDWLNVPFASAAQLQNELPISWFCHADADYSRAGERRLELLNKVLANLNQQTSLTFELQRRPGEVWLVKEQK